MAAAAALETGVASHAGKVRDHNEDLSLVAPDIGVFAVADGMGGHDDGALASATVVEQLRSIGRAASASDLLARLEDRILRANAELISHARVRGAGVVGSTVVVLLTFDYHYACVWAGDSRLYLIRQGCIVQVSRDHSEVQALIDTGALTAAEARSWPRRNIVTRAIGVRGDPELEIRDGALAGGDIFVLCSDGLTAHVDDQEILQLARDRPPQEACDALVELTLERGASDNVTVVVVRCGGEYSGTVSETPIAGGAVQ